MYNSNEKVVLITGASSGIGQACAEYLARRGYQVFGTSRRAPFPPEATQPDSPEMIRMDVDQDDSVKQAVGFILQATCLLDVVVNIAGFGIAGSVEDTSIGEAKEQFETNFFGVLRVCKAVLPAMRERRSGYIVNVSSIGGIIALPYQGLYSAAKFAVEGLTEALRMEMQPFGVHVVLIEPGDFCTGFTANRRMVLASQENQAYAERCDRIIKNQEDSEQAGASPEKIARLLERIINHPSPRPRYRVGSVVEIAAIMLKRILPGRLFEWLFTIFYGA
jgi:short-subunit dehydrogenase